MTNALVTRSSGFGGEGLEVLRVGNDLQVFEREIRQHQERLLQFDRDAQRLLGMEKHPLVRLLRHRPFKWLVVILPQPLRARLEPYRDTYAFLERESRRQLNDVQVTVLDIIATVERVVQQRNKWHLELQKAQEEKWAPEQIEAWFQKQTKNLGFSVDDRVNYLVNLEIASLDDRAYKARREEGLEQMKQLVTTADAAFEALKPTGISAVRLFEASHRQYLGIALMQRPTSVLAKTAQSLGDLNRVSLSASQVIQASLKESLDAIFEEIDAIDIVKSHMVASPETQKILLDGANKLIARLNIKQEIEEEVGADDSAQLSASHSVFKPSGKLPQ